MAVTRTTVLRPWKRKRNGSCNGIMGEPSANGEHCGTAILNLHKSAAIRDFDPQWIEAKISGQTTAFQTRCDFAFSDELAVDVGQLINFNGCNGNELKFVTIWSCIVCIEILTSGAGGEKRSRYRYFGRTETNTTDQG